MATFRKAERMDYSIDSLRIKQHGAQSQRNHPGFDQHAKGNPKQPLRNMKTMSNDFGQEDFQKTFTARNYNLKRGLSQSQSNYSHINP